MDKKILQVIPAPAGWEAVFATLDGKVDCRIPLACLALIEEIDGRETIRSVVGMVPFSQFDEVIVPVYETGNCLQQLAEGLSQVIL